MESRLTFRDKCPEICWQKQLRDRYVDEGSPVKNPDLKTAVIRKVSRKLAEQIILKYEWLGTIGINADVSYGIFFNNFCAGVTSFQPTGFAIPGFTKLLKTEGRHLSYLSRGACVHWAPKGTNSKLISYSLKFERERGKKASIAFADTDAGEIGVVYQASNWIYLGLGVKNFELVSPEGKILTNSGFTTWCSEHRKKNARALELFHKAGWKKQWSNPKHRYVYILDMSDKALIRTVESLRQPYPKRDKSGSSDQADTLGVHPREGGSIPTLPLQ